MRARRTDTETGLMMGPAGLPLGAALLVVLVAIDAATPSDVNLPGTFAIPLFVIAISGRSRATAAASCVALAAGVASGFWNHNLGDWAWIASVTIIAAAGLIAHFAARAAAEAREGMFRLRLLDRVGRIADGSLPLAETLDRITGAVVPSFVELCMIDAIREGDVRRIAVAASGPDADRIETHIRGRTPSTPDWLRDPGSDSLDPHFVAEMPDEVLVEMAGDADDLAFLRWLRPRSYVVAPLISRGRSLGALTVVRLRGSKRLVEDDTEFVTALASRIGVALDNAGLFSDLESVERRMDSVMDNVTEAVIVHDGAGNLVYANDAASGFVGFAELEGLASPADESQEERFELRDEQGEPLDPEQLPRRRTLRGEEPDPAMFRIRDRETGRETWRQEKSTPIKGPSGDVLYAVTTVQDVSAVKQAEFSQRVLADSAEAVASAGDYESALNALAQAVVPQLADWCSVTVPGPDGTIEQVAIAEHDEAMLEIDRRLREGLEVKRGTKLSMADVLRASRPVTAELPDDPTPGWVLLKPIRAAGGAIGVLTLVNRESRHAFTAEEIRLARAVADRAGVAILNAKLATERAAIAEKLQRELLPPLLPDVDGWTMAAMYRPAGELNRAGGDFYDVFEGQHGWVVVLGDVEGHGPEAAALTSMVRHTVRTAAIVDGDVLSAFEILNAQLRERDRPRLCSVVCVSFQADASEASVVSAGHPLPLLVSDGSPREVGLPGSLLGALDQPQWSPVRFSVDPGEELVIYTDGVIEARANGERFGRERLGGLLGGGSGPADTVQRVGDAIEAFGEVIADDAAMLVLRREAEGLPGPKSPSAREPLVEGVE